MLDVVHYYFDEDMRFSSLDEARMHSIVRKQLFEELYDIKYRYGLDSKTTPSGDYAEGDVKPFIPATEVDSDAPNPFGAILDAPIG